MGRGGFPPSETGSFSAHHTAQRVGFFLSDGQLSFWYQFRSDRSYRQWTREKNLARSGRAILSRTSTTLLPLTGPRVGHIMAKRSNTPAPIPDFTHFVRYLLSGVLLAGSGLVFLSELPHKIVISSAILIASGCIGVSAFKLNSKKNSSL
jgi:hypothetical protein